MQKWKPLSQKEYSAAMSHKICLLLFRHSLPLYRQFYILFLYAIDMKCEYKS